MGQRAVEAAVIGDEVLVIAGKVSEVVERVEGLFRRVFDCFGDTGRLEREAKPQRSRASDSEIGLTR